MIFGNFRINRREIRRNFEEIVEIFLNDTVNVFGTISMKFRETTRKFEP